MPAAAERAADVAGPVGYSVPWTLVAAAAVLTVVAYYVVVLWTTRPRPVEVDGGDGRPAAGRARRTARETALARLDRVEAEVASGRLSPRAGHQELSDAVRACAAAVTGRPVRAMTLEDLHREGEAGAAGLAGLLAEVYPPEFAPEQAAARDRLAGSLARARELVTTWT